MIGDIHYFVCTLSAEAYDFKNIFETAVMNYKINRHGC